MNADRIVSSQTRQQYLTSRLDTTIHVFRDSPHRLHTRAKRRQGSSSKLIEIAYPGKRLECQQPREFDDNEPVEMMIKDKSSSGSTIVSYKRFKIRSARFDSISRGFEYQLQDVDTGEPYLGDGWFPEKSLRIRRLGKAPNGSGCIIKHKLHTPILCNLKVVSIKVNASSLAHHGHSRNGLPSNKAAVHSKYCATAYRGAKGWDTTFPSIYPEDRA